MTEYAEISDTITSLVEPHFEISQITWGGPRQGFVVRYAGRLKRDSLQAHKQLTEELKGQKLSVFFLEEGEGQQVVQIIEGLPTPRRSNPLINLGLFLLTLLSMLYTGAQYEFTGSEGSTQSDVLRFFLENPAAGLPFAASLLAILLAHEFGHYIAGRIHKTDVTLPYFLPFPFSPFGTLGAFIQLKSPPRNKRELLDIGLAGPLAGLVVAIPILLLGLSLSELDHLPRFFGSGEGVLLEGNSLLYLGAKFLVFREWLPLPISYGDAAPALYWLRYLFTGLPTPLGGLDVSLNSVAWAGWAGLLVTALNMIPAGQLDGGHLLYSLFGRNARRVLPAILIGLAALGFFWSGWWLWFFLIFMMGRGHAQPLDQITKLDRTRRGMAILGLIIFVLVFTPIPLRPVIGPYFGP